MDREKQIKDILEAFPDAKRCTEGGFNFIFFPEIELPSGCTPAKVKALLCYQKRDGYESRLFLSSKITGCRQKNWNANNIRMFDSNWFAISWRTESGLTVKEMLFNHLMAFHNE